GQFFNRPENDPGGPSIDQRIIWNGFPRTLALGYGFPEAYQVADSLVSLAGLRPGLPTAPPFFAGPIWQTLVYRPQDEYCEWRVGRGPLARKVRPLPFHSEPPPFL